MGSLGLVGEVFEVRAQVDRDLTTVSRVDRQLGLNKNLGVTALPITSSDLSPVEIEASVRPFSPDSTLELGLKTFYRHGQKCSHTPPTLLSKLVLPTRTKGGRPTTVLRQ
jgi:hypothetical protein